MSGDEALGDEDYDRTKNRIPVTVLAGALGAGKTTMLKYILEKPHGYRVAVIQNEFSEEMGIESPLIKDSKGDAFGDIYELANGCLCCSAKDGLINMLDKLVEERRRFDYVLVEATGVADPESICEIFWLDDGLGSGVYLDGVVTVVDGRNALSGLDGAAGAGDAGDLGLEAEIAKQVACADVLVLNKADLSTDEQRGEIRERLTIMNPTARMLESTYSQVALDRILGIKAFDHSRLTETLSALAGDDGGSHGDAHGHSHGHEHGSDSGSAGLGHGHGDVQAAGKRTRTAGRYVAKAGHGIDSCFLRGADGALYDSQRVRAWMSDVLWENSAGGVYRCKGLFRGPPEDDSDMEQDGGDAQAGDQPMEKGKDVVFALQGVGKLFEIDAVPEVDVPYSRFLFVGRGLKAEILEEGLRKCLQG